MPVPLRRALGRKVAAACCGTFLLFLYGLRGRDLFELPYFGVTLQADRVALVEPGGPAARSGLAAGDEVTAIQGVPVSRMLLYLTDRFYSGALGDTLQVAVTSASGPHEVTLEGAPLPVTERRHIAATFVTGVGFLAIGLFAVLQIEGRLTTLFFALCSAFSIVLLPIAPPRPEWASFTFGALRAVAAVLLPSLLLHFFLVFPKLARIVRSRPNVLWWVYVPAAISLALLAYVSSGLIRPALHLHALTRLLNAMVMVSLVVYAGLALVAFVVGFLQVSSAAERRRFRVVLIGTVLGIFPLLWGTVHHLLWADLWLPGEHAPLLSLLLIPLSFAYAIVRYHVLDIEVVVKRSAAFSLLTACLFLIAYGVYAIFGNLLEDLTGGRNRWIMVLSLLAVASLFSPLRARIEKLVDRAFFRDRYDERRALRELGQELPSILRLQDLLSAVVDKLSRTLRVREVAIFLSSARSKEFVVAYASGLLAEDLDLPALPASFIEISRRARRPVRTSEVEANLPFGLLGDREERILNQFHGGVLVPVHSQNELIAVLFLGRRGGGESYGFEDLELLQAFAGQAGLGMRNAFLHVQQLEQERIARELLVARDLQRRLLPEADPEVPGLDVSGATQTCTEVGGDFYTYVPFSDGRLGFAVGDVSGHGVPAALLMASLSATLRAEADRHGNPGSLLDRLNQRTCDAIDPGQFLSVFYGIWDPRTREMEFANAGHPAPLVIEPSGEVAALSTGGLLLGIDRGATYRCRRHVCPEGSVLLLFTDGLVENQRGTQEFGEERLVELVRADGQLSAEGLRLHILAEVRRFGEGEPEDDVTLIVLRVS